MHSSVWAALASLLALAFAAPAQAKVVTWPKLSSVQPGAKLTVKVASRQRRAQLAFVRVAPRATLARKTLRSGRFTVTVPKGDGVTYELRATIAGKRTIKRFTTPAAPAATAPVGVAPAPVPIPAPPAVDCAAGNTGTAQLAVAGGRITVTNAGPGCLDVPVGLPLTWTTADGDVIPVDCDGNALPIGGKPPTCIGLPAFEVLHQGESTVRRFAVPAGLAAGTYTVSALGAAVSVDV